MPSTPSTRLAPPCPLTPCGYSSPLVTSDTRDNTRDHRPAIMPPPPLVAVAAWLVPGSGYWLIGQRGRALAVGLTIVALFAAGILIAGIRVVEAPNLFGSSAGSAGIVVRILQNPCFLGQVLTGS